MEGNLKKFELSKVAVLETIYDKVTQVGDNRYVVSIADKYGFVSSDGICTDVGYTKLYYTDKYAILVDEKSQRGKVILFTADSKEGLEYSLSLNNKVFTNTTYLIEHSALGFGIVELRLDTNEENQLSIINTSTGKILGVRESSGQYAYRPYNNYIIIAFFDVNEQCIKAITQDFEVLTVDEALEKRYKDVRKIQKNKRYKPFYQVKDIVNGQELTLNQFGQLY